MLIPRPAALGYMKDFPGWQLRVVIKSSMHALLTVFLPPPAKRVGKQGEISRDVPVTVHAPWIMDHILPPAWQHCHSKQKAQKKRRDKIADQDEICTCTCFS
jgi:hypothetical protein